MEPRPQLIELTPLGPMARRLRVPVGWLRDECDADRVPHLKAGRAYLFDPAAVVKALLKRAGQGAGQEAYGHGLAI